ncbi:MAG TPA: cytochrome c, partial [Pirellulales bacterium]|nr:cytochrome c [Pirellulales bacterium]
EPNGASARQPVAGTVARGHLQTDWALFTGRSVPPTPVSAQGARESTFEKSGAGGNSAASTDSSRRAGDERPVPPAPGENSRANNSSPSSQSSAEVVITAELANYSDIVDEFPIPITEQVIEHGMNRYMIYCVVCHDAAGTGRGKIVERGYTPPPSYHIDRLRNAPVGHLFRVVTLGYGSMPSYASQIPVRDRWAIIAYVRTLQLSQHFPEDQLPEDLRKRFAEAQRSSVAGKSTDSSSLFKAEKPSSAGGKQP